MNSLRRPLTTGRRLALFQRADDRAAGVIGVFHGSFEVDVRNIFAPFDLFELQADGAVEGKDRLLGVFECLGQESGKSHV